MKWCYALFCVAKSHKYLCNYTRQLTFAITKRSGTLNAIWIIEGSDNQGFTIHIYSKTLIIRTFYYPNSI